MKTENENNQTKTKQRCSGSPLMSLVMRDATNELILAHAFSDGKVSVDKDDLGKEMRESILLNIGFDFVRLTRDDVLALFRHFQIPEGADLKVAYYDGWHDGYFNGLGDGHPLATPSADVDDDYVSSDTREYVDA